MDYSKGGISVTDFQADLSYNWEFTFKKQHSHLCSDWLHFRRGLEHKNSASSGKDQWQQATKYNSVNKPGDIFSEYQI